jgi:hypothetical protein
MVRPGNRREVRIEGLLPEEILALSQQELDALIFCGETVAFRAGSAELLGEFRRTHDRITLELAQIDGGGEGVLPTLGALARRHALRVGASEVEWLVHAVNCARPNLKLRAVLERRGFQVEDVPGVGACYRFVERLPQGLDRDG